MDCTNDNFTTAIKAVVLIVVILIITMLLLYLFSKSSLLLLLLWPLGIVSKLLLFATTRIYMATRSSVMPAFSPQISAAFFFTYCYSLSHWEQQGECDCCSWRLWSMLPLPLWSWSPWTFQSQIFIRYLIHSNIRTGNAFWSTDEVYVYYKKLFLTCRVWKVARVV